MTSLENRSQSVVAETVQLPKGDSTSSWIDAKDHNGILHEITSLYFHPMTNWQKINSLQPKMTAKHGFCLVNGI